MKYTLKYVQEAKDYATMQMRLIDFIMELREKKVKMSRYTWHAENEYELLIEGILGEE